jgi:hypothetical protein
MYTEIYSPYTTIQIIAGFGRSARLRTVPPALLSPFTAKVAYQ